MSIEALGDDQFNEWLCQLDQTDLAQDVCYIPLNENFEEPRSSMPLSRPSLPSSSAHAERRSMEEVLKSNKLCGDDAELQFNKWLCQLDEADMAQDARYTPVNEDFEEPRSSTPLPKRSPLTCSTRAKRKSMEGALQSNKLSDTKEEDAATPKKRACVIDEGEHIIDVTTSRLAATQRVAHAAGRISSLRWSYEGASDEPSGAFCDSVWFGMAELKSFSIL